MDFSVKDNILTFLNVDDISDYLIFYFDKSWDNCENIILKIGSNKNNMIEINMNKNYVKIPSVFTDNKTLLLQMIGDKGLDKIETNYEIGRRV